jgi:hypothetical protein
MTKEEILKEHYELAKGRRCGTTHKLDSEYSIIVYDHDAVCFDSPAKARLEHNNRCIKVITAKEPEELNIDLLFNLYKQAIQRGIT